MENAIEKFEAQRMNVVAFYIISGLIVLYAFTLLLSSNLGTGIFALMFAGLIFVFAFYISNHRRYYTVDDKEIALQGSGLVIPLSEIVGIETNVRDVTWNLSWSRSLRTGNWMGKTYQYNTRIATTLVSYDNWNAVAVYTKMKKISITGDYDCFALTPKDLEGFARTINEKLKSTKTK